MRAVFEELKALATSQSVRSVKDLPVNGDDVMTLTGVSPGPHVGATLRRLFDRVVNGEFPDDRRQLLMAIEVEHEMESLPFD